jgi:hypothetical protein
LPMVTSTRGLLLETMLLTTMSSTIGGDTRLDQVDLTRLVTQEPLELAEWSVLELLQPIIGLATISHVTPALDL